MKSKKTIKAFLLLTAGLVLTLVPFSTGSSNTNPVTFAAVQRLGPPPIPSVDGTWFFSGNAFAGPITFNQHLGGFDFTGGTDVCVFECGSFMEPHVAISGKVIRLNEFTPITISFLRGSPPTQVYTGTVLFKAVGPSISRAVGMFGTFTDVSNPGRNFPWYAVRD
jgi:hypothetical protein